MKSVKKSRILRDTIKSARRCMVFYINAYQQGKVSENKVKTMAYLLCKYAELFKISKIEDLENKLIEIESRLPDL